ncbi:cell wall-associated NlpC family hydrolase [Streptomyces sp. B1I3]|nr:cell wall-associated NlpC family hydrolase [Streptomyces sp. B1I3]
MDSETRYPGNSSHYTSSPCAGFSVPSSDRLSTAAPRTGAAHRSPRREVRRWATPPVVARRRIRAGPPAPPDGQSNGRTPALVAAPRKAAHRKPKQRLFTGPAARTAATLAFAGAATATAFEGAAQAEPPLTPAQVKAEVDRLYHEAEIATEQYNGAKEKAAATARSLDTLRDEAARRTERLNASRDALGSFAAAQYRTGGIDPAVRLALSSDPDQYLRRAAYLDRAGDRQAGALNGVRRQVGDIAQLRARAEGELATLAARRAELQKRKDTVRSKLADARRLLATLTAAERADYERTADAAHGGGAARADRGVPRGSVAASGARAAQAVDFAYGALGKPYVWGSTGPSSFDCSGLTQAAWRAAGVSLPRTTYTQINAGRRVSRLRTGPGRPGVLLLGDQPRRALHRRGTDDPRPPTRRPGPHRPHQRNALRRSDPGGIGSAPTGSRQREGPPCPRTPPSRGTRVRSPCAPPTTTASARSRCDTTRAGS